MDDSKTINLYDVSVYLNNGQVLPFKAKSTDSPSDFLTNLFENIDSYPWFGFETEDGSAAILSNMVFCIDVK